MVELKRLQVLELRLRNEEGKSSELLVNKDDDPAEPGDDELSEDEREEMPDDDNEEAFSIAAPSFK